jgi:myosin-5
MIQSMELNKLCAIILEKTIADPDMYQNGLTKIFFRAGMLAALESMRSGRLNALVTVVQKNMRRRMAVKRYKELRTATIKIQTWWRGIMARKLVENMRKAACALRVQTAIRRFVQRKRFVDVRRSVVLVQSRKFILSIHSLSPALSMVFFQAFVVCRPDRTSERNDRPLQQLPCKACFVECTSDFSLIRETDPPTDLILGSVSRRAYKREVKLVVYLQSCIRRRLARKELKALRAEARSVSKFKEISYRLENKVVELTQSLQERTSEKKKLQTQLSELEQQLQQWINRHEEADSKAKGFQTSLQTAEAELSKRDELLQSKADVEKKLEEAVASLQEKENLILKLTEDVANQALQLEQQQRAIQAAPVRDQGDSSVILTLKNEVSSLREQLNRANALNTLTKGTRHEPPTSPTFAPTLRLGEPPVPANGRTGAPPATGGRGHQRRHSSAGVFSIGPSDDRLSTDESLGAFKRNNAVNPRAVSVAFNGEDNYMRFRQPNGLSDIRDYDDPAEEKIRLMQETDNLDKDVLEGLIRGLKIPAPSLTNPPAMKEILFPANLISLVTNEMWKYGLIQESERFLANVMQSIQAHVMVSSFYLSVVYGC